MSTTLPSLTKTIDNAFVTTWYTIRAEAIDNILNANVIWAALKARGCLKSQVGGDMITRTISYGTTDATEIERGDMLPAGEDELETMAIWRFRTLASRVQRNMFDDQKNQGKDKIKDLVATKLKAAKEGLETKYESGLFNTIVTAETGKKFQGLHDMVPPIASRTTGTYGGIARASVFADSGNGVNVGTGGVNPWWAPKYLAGTAASIEDDLLTDMKKLYGSCHNNQVPPDLIVTTQNVMDIYEEFALDISQIIKDEATHLADLGFEVLRFKGKPLVWSPSMTANHMLMLNTSFIEVVYDPTYWFMMTNWKDVSLQPDRIAHIICFANMISDQLRRHGRLEYA